MKSQVKARLIVVKNKLKEVEDILTGLDKKHKTEGKPGLTKTIDFYIKELKFDPKTVMEGLDEEIKAVKTKTDEVNLMHVSKIKSLMERISQSKEEQ